MVSHFTLSNESLLSFIDSDLPLYIAWICFLLVFLRTISNAFRHLSNYTRPDLQPHVLRIIMVAPIYALGAALCLSLESRSSCFYILTARDIWEAIVIHSFLQLIVEYMGGEHLCLYSISQREEPVPHLFPFNLCFDPAVPTSKMIRVPKMGALQFVIVKPVLAVFSIVAHALDVYEGSFYQWVLFVVYNISYSIALYALYIIYWASHGHASLCSKRPLMKFLSVKMVVFLTFWQTLLLPYAPIPGDHERWEDLLVVLETVIFSWLLNSAFSWREFHSGLRGQTPLPKDLGTVRFQSDDLIDLEDSASTQKPTASGQSAASGQQKKHAVIESAKMAHESAKQETQEAMRNAKTAFCPRDVLDDATRCFSTRYSQHVLMESAQEYELHKEEEQKVADFLTDANVKKEGKVSTHLRTFRAKTYIVGHSLYMCGNGPTSAATTREEKTCNSQSSGDLVSTESPATCVADGGTVSVSASSSRPEAPAPVAWNLADN